jgi:hypothetical protein
MNRGDAAIGIIGITYLAVIIGIEAMRPTHSHVGTEETNHSDKIDVGVWAALRVYANDAFHLVCTTTGSIGSAICAKLPELGMLAAFYLAFVGPFVFVAAFWMVAMAAILAAIRIFAFTKSLGRR